LLSGCWDTQPVAGPVPTSQPITGQAVLPTDPPQKVTVVFVETKQDIPGFVEVGLVKSVDKKEEIVIPAHQEVVEARQVPTTKPALKLATAPKKISDDNVLICLFFFVIIGAALIVSKKPKKVKDKIEKKVVTLSVSKLPGLVLSPVIQESKLPGLVSLPKFSGLKQEAVRMMNVAREQLDPWTVKLL
jgi:hypothetical protein